MFSDRKKNPAAYRGQPLSPCGGATFNKQYVKEPIYEDFVVIDFETTGLFPIETG
jgi:DNA polymerase III epsilon subunit-like protein